MRRLRISLKIAAAMSVLWLSACSQTVVGDAMVLPADAGQTSIDASNTTVDAAVDAGGADATPCVDGDVRASDPQSGTCYMLFQTPQSWTSARDLCAALGGTLATVESQAEQDIVGPLSANYGAAPPDLWLGATDVAVETQWTWVNGVVATFTKWRDGEPNNNGGEGVPENCMVIEGDNPAKEWDDRKCDDAFAYICERL